MTYWQMKRMGTALVPSQRMRHFSFFIFIFHFSLLISHLLLTSCSGSSDSPDDVLISPDGPSVLNIYVYAPGQAVPTRGNEGEVDATAAENAIHTLQIWVFTHDDVTPANDGKLVTYFKTNAFLQTPTENDTYKFELPIDETFASTSEDDRPTVDVYVLANVTSNNCGLNFDEHTAKTDLENAVLAENYFGVTNPVTAVPFEGLPMSGKLTNQTVSGSKPVLTLGTSSTEMAKVKLARAVSKVRFVFSCSTDFDGLKITQVTFDANMIPTQEYLFLDQDYTVDGNYTKIGGVYNTDVTSSLFSINETAICADPAYYAWDRLVNDMKIQTPSITSQELAVAYENLINEGVSTIHEEETAPRLTEKCLYLRESDKRLAGTIKYKVKEKDADDYGAEIDPPATFQMVGPESPATWQPYFSRNHTWTVYAYLAWAKMNIVAIHINDWETADPGDYTFHNW